MSALAAHLAAAIVPLVGHAYDGTGVLDWIGAKNKETQTLFRGMAVTVGIVFIIINAIKSQMAMSRVIISVVVAGILIAGVWKITTIRDKVGNEIDDTGMAPAYQVSAPFLRG